MLAPRAAHGAARVRLVEARLKTSGCKTPGDYEDYISGLAECGKIASRCLPNPGRDAPHKAAVANGLPHTLRKPFICR